MVVVAHPDDCVIFAYSYIHNQDDHDWTICYLTYDEHTPRGREIQAFWHRRNIATCFLGFEDRWDHAHQSPGLLEFDQVAPYIARAIADQDLIVTHNEQGEYGHPHHVLCNRATAHHQQRVTFAGHGQGQIKYQIPAGVYDLDELPLHRHIIEQFHPVDHVNEYNL